MAVWAVQEGDGHRGHGEGEAFFLLKLKGRSHSLGHCLALCADTLMQPKCSAKNTLGGS